MIRVTIGLLMLAYLYMVIMLAGLYKDVKRMEEQLWELYNNRNHISQMEQSEIEMRGRNNLELISMLAKEVDKRVEAVHQSVGLNGSIDYTLTDLTEKDKKISELRSEIKALEEEE